MRKKPNRKSKQKTTELCYKLNVKSILFDIYAFTLSRLPALNRSTSESPQNSFLNSIAVQSKALARSNTEIIQLKMKNIHSSSKANHKFKNGTIVATAFLKPVKKNKKLTACSRIDSDTDKMESATNEVPICGKITLKKIKTKFKKKKNDDENLSQQQITSNN